jgi:hypothetical protein
MTTIMNCEVGGIRKEPVMACIQQGSELGEFYINYIMLISCFALISTDDVTHTEPYSTHELTERQLTAIIQLINFITIRDVVTCLHPRTRATGGRTQTLQVTVSSSDKMGQMMLLGLLIGCVLYADMASAARGGGGGKGRSGGRKGYGSRMPVLILHRNPASASYYDHKDVSTCFKQHKNKASQNLLIYCKDKPTPQKLINNTDTTLQIMKSYIINIHVENVIIQCEEECQNEN